jgi:hypothetical protein
VRFRDEKLTDLDRARAAVGEWRDANPEGTREQMLAALGPRFHPDYAIVLRGVLFAVDRKRSAAEQALQTRRLPLWDRHAAACSMETRAPR